MPWQLNPDGHTSRITHLLSIHCSSEVPSGVHCHALSEHGALVAVAVAVVVTSVVVGVVVALIEVVELVVVGLVVEEVVVVAGVVLTNP